MTTLREFWQKLDVHDWYYAFSDDGRVYNAGIDAEKKLRKIAGESPAHKELMDGFVAHYFSGDPWKTEKKPRPPELKEEA